jgi:hypothetical protein
MRSSTLLWTLVIVFAGAVIWLAVTGRLEAGANYVVDMFLNFFANIARTLRR